MEAGLGSLRSRRPRELLLVAAFTLLVHAPFLRQAVQGDEVNYLEIAAQVFRQPFTPLNFQYVFKGQLVDVSGHPHPPLNAYLLALAWWLRGHFAVLSFHVFYLIFAVGIGFAAYALAARFTSRPLWAALLVASSPLVQVNTNTVASPEAPALAFMLAGAAAYFWGRFGIAGIFLCLAGLTELQGLVIGPILLLEFFVKRQRPPRAAWLVAAAPFAALAGWQGFQWAMTHHLPLAVLAGYAKTPGLSGASVKVASALALLAHLGVLVTLVPVAKRRLWCLGPGLLAALLVHGYPWWERALLVIFIALGVNALTWLWEARRIQPALAGWCLLYFGFAAFAFFAGASRYLLPLAAPMALLFALQFEGRRKWLGAALGVNLVLGLNISFAAYEFSRVYAQLDPPPGRPFLVDGEWGFRYYMLAKGGRMLETSTVPGAGEWIVSSELSLGGNFDSPAEEIAVPLRTVDLRVRTPLRLIDREVHTGFSSAALGLLPFSFSNRPLDRITYSRTSPFLDAPWTPTRFSDHLVYLPDSGAAIRLPFDGDGALHFALFAKGRGTAAFAIRDASGQVLFERRMEVGGDLWEPQVLPLTGLHEASFSVEASPGLQAGWGQMVVDSDQATPQKEQALPILSDLKLRDIRVRPQLLSGWYGIEEGAWRWMSGSGVATLKSPADRRKLRVAFYLPNTQPPRRVRLLLDGREVASASYSQSGAYVLESPPLQASGATCTVEIDIDPTFFAPNDARPLGAVVTEVGFVP